MSIIPKGKRSTLWLYLVSSGLNGYGIYAGMVVAATSEEQARNTHSASENADTDMEWRDTGEAECVIQVTPDGFIERTRHFYGGNRKGETKLLKSFFVLDDWAKHPRDVTVTLIGEANHLLYSPGDVVITDYHAG